jgi:hypothetical protein
MLDWLMRIFHTRYVGMLEGEVQRLRAENRALTNSLLGTAGFPPLDFPQAPAAQPLPRVRKRSWHQIQAWRESDAAREAASHLDSELETRPNGPVPHS